MAAAVAEVRLPSVDRGAFEAGVLPFLHMHALEPMQAIPRVRVRWAMRLLLVGRHVPPDGDLTTPYHTIPHPPHMNRSIDRSTGKKNSR